MGKYLLVFVILPLVFIPTLGLSIDKKLPPVVDVSELKALGEQWEEENPYRNNSKAIEIGGRAYNQLCARCHGLNADSSGIAPDLRNLPTGQEGDKQYVDRVREGSIKNGITYMPRMADHVSQEALWAIRAWLETVSKDN